MRIENCLLNIEKKHKELLSASGNEMIEGVKRLSGDRNFYNLIRGLDFKVDEIDYSYGFDDCFRLTTSNYDKMEELSLSSRKGWLTFNFKKTIFYQDFDGFNEPVCVQLETPEIIDKNLDVIYTNQGLIGHNTEINYFVSSDKMLGHYLRNGINKNLIGELDFYLKKFRSGKSPFEKNDPRL